MGGRIPTLLGALAALAIAGCSASSGGSRPAGERATSGPPVPAPSSVARITTSAPPPQSSSAKPPPPSPAPRNPTPRTPAPIPPVSARAHAAGLVDVRTAVPDAVIDLRYATTGNFTHVRLYPVRARCLVHRSMVRGLKIAARAVRARGLVLVFWDCYRPHAVQVRMFEIVPNPNWVARPGPYATSHEAGRSVDVTLAHRSTGGTCAHRVHGHCLLAMGTGFDDFTPRAWAFATRGVSARAVADRALLRHAMARGGITIYAGEWWHFDGPGAKTPRPHLNAPVY